MSQMLPLADVRVLDLTRLLPGGVCSQMLADMGADVIKIEDPFGGDYARWMPPLVDAHSVYFRMNNRGKRSVVINLKEADGQDILKTLVKSADVLIEGFRPGVMARLGCDYATLKGVNPRLVYCALSGWGADGPYSQYANHDLNYVATAGLIGAMETPQVMGGQVADIGGAFIAVAGILAALLRRATTDEGAFVDTALAEAALPFALYNWVESGATAEARSGNLSGGLACYRVYRTLGGGHVSLAALEPKFWENFCNAIDRPDLIADYQASARQDYLIKELDQLFAMQTLEHWDEVLSGADCCYMPVTPLAEVTNDPHFRARRMVGTFTDGTRWMRSPVRMSDAEPHITNTIPDHGEHTRAVLREAGYDDAEIERLRTTGIIKAG